MMTAQEDCPVVSVEEQALAVMVDTPLLVVVQEKQVSTVLPTSVEVQDVTLPAEPPTLHLMAYVEATRRARATAICKNFISDHLLWCQVHYVLRRSHFARAHARTSKRALSALGHTAVSPTFVGRPAAPSIAPSLQRIHHARRHTALAALRTAPDARAARTCSATRNTQHTVLVY